MVELSISKAWEQTKEVIARDGRLIASVALALIALPAVVSGLVAPKGYSDPAVPGWGLIVVLLAALVGVAGQLAVIRLALGPAITVGDAIVHGLKRFPFYLAAAILIGAGLLILAIPFVAIVAALGVPLTAEGFKQSPPAILLWLVYVAIAFYLGLRMIMASPVASAEAIGPIAIIRRSWNLTAGRWWRLFGFIVLYLLGAIVVLAAAGAAIGIVATLLLGSPDPLSASALLVAIVMAFVNAGVTALLAVMLARIYVQLSGRSSVAKSGT